MVLLAHISPAAEGRDRRREARRLVTLVTSVAQSSDQDTPIRILNLSRTGLLFEAEAHFEIGEMFLLDLPEIGATSVRIRRRDGQAYGCEFLSPVTQAAVSAALLKSYVPVDGDQIEEIISASMPRAEYQRSPRDPRLVTTFALAMPFVALLTAIALALALLPVG